MSSKEYKSHYSVMLRDCMAFLSEAAKEKTPRRLADMTFGAGGHSLAMAKAYPESIVYSTDQDPEALANGKKIIENEGLEERLTLFNMNFESFPSLGERKLARGT